MEIWAVGGYSEIGKNMTAVRIGNDVVVFDMGLHMDRIVKLEEENEEPLKLSTKRLIEAEALPDDREFFKEWGNKVKAIIVTHAHLDHLGGVVKLADKYKCPILMTPFTAEVLNNIVKNEKLKFNSRVIRLNPGNTYKVSENIKAEFIHITHSTPQTVMVALHTKEGIITYAVDWKFDEYPTLGKRTNYARIKELAREGIKVLICDSTRIERETRTYSESYVKEMFKDILFWTQNEENAIFITTFASHVARINMLVKMAKDMGRTPLILGRSMHNYLSAAERAGVANISKDAKILGFKRQIGKALRDVEKNREKYLVICTGGQGEPNSVMQRIATDQFKFRFRHGDQVIFSCSVIPTEVNEANRKMLEQELKNKEVRIFKNVHQSGHGSKEDIRDMLLLTKPKNYIPTHGELKKLAAAVELAREEGYHLGKSVHLLQDGQKLVI